MIRLLLVGLGLVLAVDVTAVAHGARGSRGAVVPPDVAVAGRTVPVGGRDLPRHGSRALRPSQRLAASRSAVRWPLRRAGRWVDVTAYCATGNPTASGVWPQVGMAATLDRGVPFGTRLEVPGVGTVTVTDRIGWGSDLDLYLGAGAACQDAADRWGRRRLFVAGAW